MLYILYVFCRPGGDRLFLDWDGPGCPRIPMEQDSQLNSMIGIMASKRWGWAEGRCEDYEGLQKST